MQWAELSEDYICAWFSMLLGGGEEAQMQFLHTFDLLYGEWATRAWVTRIFFFGKLAPILVGTVQYYTIIFLCIFIYMYHKNFTHYFRVGGTCCCNGAFSLFRDYIWKSMCIHIYSTMNGLIKCSRKDHYF